MYCAELRVSYRFNPTLGKIQDLAQIVMSFISSSHDASYDVYLGFWTNWSYGKVRGATITVSRENGSLLITFLALFVGAAGKSLWRLFCYAIHQAVSQADVLQDGFYHQRQAILRNSETSMQGAWQLFYSIIVWKRRYLFIGFAINMPTSLIKFSYASIRVLQRGIPIIAAAVVLSCGFGFASIFSSRVSSGSTNEVLLSGRKCGLTSQKDILLKGDKEDESAFWNESVPWAASRPLKYLSYARSCYQNFTDVGKCDYYIRPRLPLYSNRNAGCPFTSEICISQSGNIQLDTGYIDSHEDLGLNTPSVVSSTDR